MTNIGVVVLEEKERLEALIRMYDIKIDRAKTEEDKNRYLERLKITYNKLKAIELYIKIAQEEEENERISINRKN